MEELLAHIDNLDLAAFSEEWEKNKNEFGEAERQELLKEIIAFHYDDKQFPFFQKILDLIIGEGLNLNFHIEHWAPSFLSLAVHVVSESLFDYLLSKNADINFIGDPYAFEDDEYIRTELKIEDRRFATCLDFALLKLSEMMNSDYNYQRPDWTGIDTPWAEIDGSEEITIRKKYYAYILEQSQYLYELIHLNGLINHIRETGGKTYSELK
jgi:hypothetical protein